MNAARTAGEPRFLPRLCPGFLGGAGLLARDPGSGRAAACGEWPRVAPAAVPLLPAPGALQPLSPAQPQPQLQQLPPHLQQASAAEPRAPCARAAGPGGTASAGSLPDFHPSCFPASSFPRQPGLGRAWGGGDRAGGGAPGSGLRGKREGGRRRGRAHTPLSWHRPLLCGWALPPGAAARACRGLGEGAGSSGV